MPTSTVHSNPVGSPLLEAFVPRATTAELQLIVFMFDIEQLRDAYGSVIAAAHRELGRRALR